jgi:hypothetical protein
MLERVAVALGSGGNQIAGAIFAGEIESVEGAERSNLESGNAVDGVVDGAGGAGEVKNEINFADVNGSQISRSTSSKRGSRRRCSRLERRPVSRLSTATTCQPSPRRASHR